MKIFSSTIVAPATIIGESSISILRISGRDTFRICEKIFSISKDKFKQVDFKKIKTHSLTHGFIVDKEKVIDEVIISVYKSPRSYTGEDVIEVSSHGGGVVFRQILNLILKRGAKTAEPGEFTKRAFLNGKMDLTEAEAVSDLIRAKSDSAAEYAMKQLNGFHKSLFENVRNKLIDLCAAIELQIDFIEEDVEIISKDKLMALINELINDENILIKSYFAGEKIVKGINVVIAGEPNVGKSCIFNRLLSQNRAIISDIPGTTRDYISESIIIDGQSFNIFDTAGIRETDNIIEKTGVNKTKHLLENADIIFIVFDINNYNTKSIINKQKDKKNAIFLLNKIDLLDIKDIHDKQSIIPISAKTGKNFNILMEKLSNFAKTQIFQEHHSENYITNTRHYHKMLTSCEHLVKAKELFEKSKGVELIIIEIKQALMQIDELLGKTTNEEILNNIFSNFCIGK